MPATLYATKDFTDVGTGKSFEAGDAIVASDGELANYLAAGLASYSIGGAAPGSNAPVAGPAAYRNALARGRAWADLRLKQPLILDDGVMTKSRPADAGAAITIADFPTVAPNGQRTGVSIAAPGGDTFTGFKVAVDTPFVLSDAVSVGALVYFPQGSANGGITGGVNLRLTLSSDASMPGGNFTKRRYFNFLPAQMKPGWNLLTVSPAGDGTTEPGGATWTVQGGMALGETVNFAQIDFGSTAGGVTSYCAQIFANLSKPAMPVISFGFDDFAQARHQSVALPILKAAGFRASLGGDGNAVKANAARLQALRDEGWDLINQGNDHTPFGSSGANEAKLALQFEQGRAQLAAFGLTGALDLFAYPQASYSTATLATLAAKGVALSRAASRPNTPMAPWGIDQGLIAHNDLSALTLNQAKKRVDSALLYGELVLFLIHDLIPRGSAPVTGNEAPPGNALQWYSEDYAALVAYVKAQVDAGQMLCLTLSEWLASVRASASA